METSSGMPAKVVRIVSGMSVEMLPRTSNTPAQMDPSHYDVDKVSLVKR